MRVKVVVFQSAESAIFSSPIVDVAEGAPERPRRPLARFGEPSCCRCASRPLDHVVTRTRPKHSRHRTRGNFGERSS